MPELPSGIVTFLFTDIEGSTALWERDRRATWRLTAAAMALRDTAIQAHGGIHFTTVGEGGVGGLFYRTKCHVSSGQLPASP